MTREGTTTSSDLHSRKVYRSISFALSNAAMQLLTSKDPGSRAAGEALLQAEPVGQYEHSDLEHIPYRGRLTIKLGFYAESARSAVNEHEFAVARAITAMLVGPMAPTVQISTEMLPDTWHMRRYEPGSSVNIRLHHLLTASEIVVSPELAIVLRRLRYRLGNDHNWQPQHSEDLIVWGTSKTKSWAERVSSDSSRPGRVASAVASRVGGTSAVTDWADMGANDWGAVDLESDPVRIVEVTTRTGVTVTEVDRVLAAASPWITRSPARSTATTREDRPVEVFASALEGMAKESGLAAHVDVVLCHRGGGLYPAGHTRANVTEEQREALLSAALKVRNQGVEVIFGLGHGDVSVLPAGVDEVGIYEATTPTAAAAWLVNEHISDWLVDKSIALGQSNGR